MINDEFVGYHLRQVKAEQERDNKLAAWRMAAIAGLFLALCEIAWRFV
jgi:hypothetical protein